MICLVLFLFVNLNSAVHCNLYTNNDYSIQMTLKPVLYMQGGVETVQKTFKVLRHKTFNITLINHVATSAICRCMQKNYGFRSVFEVDDGNSVIKFPEATYDMTEKWLCAIETMGRVLKLTFYVRVVGDQKVDIRIAGRTIRTKVSDSPEVAYDELADYYFKDGETVQLICNNFDKQKPGDIYLRYYDPLDTILIETDRFYHDESAFFQRTMKPEDNNHAIEFTYVTRDSNLMFPYRVVFKLINNSTIDNFTIWINELKMRPTETKLIGNNQVKYYRFTYIRSQILTVSFKTTHEENNSTLFSAEYNKKYKCSNSFIEINKTSLEYTVQLNTKCIEGTYCKLRVLKEDVTKSFPIVEILLKNSEFPELLISGLTAKNVIDQYRKNRTTWLIDYWYTAGEPLPLSCVARYERNLRWILGTTDVGYGVGKNISHNFTLSEAYNGSFILCEDVRNETNIENNRRTIVKLHRKSRYLVFTDDPDKVPDPNESSNSNVIVIIILSVATLVSAFGISFACCMYVKKKKTRDTQNATPSNRLQSRPLPDVPIQTQPLDCYDYAYSSSHYAEIELDESRNENRVENRNENCNQQNTMYYWAFE